VEEEGWGGHGPKTGRSAIEEEDGEEEDGKEEGGEEEEGGKEEDGEKEDEEEEDGEEEEDVEEEKCNSVTVNMRCDILTAMKISVLLFWTCRQT
jgi:hypothetical protein